MPSLFDLPGCWCSWCARAANAPQHLVTLRIAATLEPHLAHTLGAAAAEQLPEAPRDAQDWAIIHMAFDSLHAARDRLLSLGGFRQAGGALYGPLG